MWCSQTKLRVTIKGKAFENRTYNVVSGIGIPELLMDVISYHEFVNNTKSDLILSCHIKLVDYRLQKCFVLHENN